MAKKFITIFGLPNSGKTAFVAALTNHLAKVEKNPPYIVPKNEETKQYIEKIWDQLFTKKQEPSSKGRFLTEWIFHATKNQKYDLGIYEGCRDDLSGLNRGSFIELIANYAVVEGYPAFLTFDFKRAVQSKEETSFIEEFLRLTDRHSVALLLTKFDRWQSEISPALQAQPPIEWIKHYFPHLYSVLEKNKERVSIFPVSAVNETQSNFPSEGLDPIILWLCEALKTHISSERSLLMKISIGVFVPLFLLAGSVLLFNSTVWYWISGILAFFVIGTFISLLWFASATFDRKCFRERVVREKNKQNVPTTKESSQ